MSYENPGILMKIIEKLLGIFFKKRYKSFVNKLSLNGDERVLEFGSGGGRMSLHLLKALQRGGRLLAIDISSYWQRVLKTRLKNFNNLDCHLGELTKADFDEGSFDLIVIHYAYHHLPNAELSAYAKEMVRILKESGKLVICEPLPHVHKGEYSLTADMVLNIFQNEGLEKIDFYENKKGSKITKNFKITFTKSAS